MKGSLFTPDINEFIDAFKELKSVKLVADYYKRSPSVVYDYIKRNNINIKEYSRRSDKWKPPNDRLFIDKYDELKNANSMAKYFGVCKKTILSYAKEIGYTNHYRAELTDEQVHYICSQYYLKSAKEIAKELNMSKSLISKTWKQNGFIGKINRTYYCNENYFKTIDTPERAYLLGLIASDGCVYKRENHIGVLSLSFHEKEIELLNIVQRELETNQPILHKENIISLAINSDILFNDLKNYNIVPRKTWIYEPVSLENDKLTWHYLRGYLDGDGSIYYCKKNPDKLHNWNVVYCGNQKTMEFISVFLNDNNILHEFYKDNREKKYNNDFYCIRISNIDEIKDFIDNLYLDSKNIRGRKYKYAMEFLDIYNSKRGSGSLESSGK